MKTRKTLPTIDLQLPSQASTVPSLSQFKQWSAAALLEHQGKASLCIRVVDEAESAELNSTYRHKQGPTNVLSFPFAAPDGLELETNYLGDLVICAPVVEREAETQQIPLMAHWAHMTIHGVLHLLGYDHIIAEDAEVMEQLEAQILTQLGFANPYGD